MRALYESMEDWCDNEYIIEGHNYKFVISLLCDDCGINHYFSYVEEYESIEDVWNSVMEDMEE